MIGAMGKAVNPKLIVGVKPLDKPGEKNPRQYLFCDYDGNGVFDKGTDEVRLDNGNFDSFIREGFDPDGDKVVHLSAQANMKKFGVTSLDGVNLRELPQYVAAIRKARAKAAEGSRYLEDTMADVPRVAKKANVSSDDAKKALSTIDMDEVATNRKNKKRQKCMANIKNAKDSIADKDFFNARISIKVLLRACAKRENIPVYKVTQAMDDMAPFCKDEADCRSSYKNLLGKLEDAVERGDAFDVAFYRYLALWASEKYAKNTPEFHEVAQELSKASRPKEPVVEQ